MSRLTIAVAAGVLCGLTSTTICHAQSTAPVARPFTLKLGAFSPSSSDTRDFSGDTHFLLDATYEFGKVADVASPLLYGAYFDAMFQSSRTFSQDYDYVDDEGNYAGTESFSATGKTSAYGVGVQARFVLPQYGYQRREGYRPYIGGGLGVYGVSAKTSVSDTGVVPEGDEFDLGSFSYSKTVTGLGGKIMIGVQERSGFVGEFSYHFFPKVDDLDMSGYGIQVGYRF